MMKDLIVQKARKQDRRAQAKLYENYIDAMYYTAFGILGSQVDAEDVLQESFVKAFKEIKGLDKDAGFGAWLKRIVINTSLNHLKYEQRYVSQQDDIEEVLIEEEEDDEFNSQGRSVEQIEEAIRELPDRYRQVIYLYLFEGLSH